MKQTYLIPLFLWASPALAQCPDPTLDAERFAATGPELIAPQTYDVRAEGRYVAPCPAWVLEGFSTGDLAGFLPNAPTAVYDLSGMAPHIMMVMAEAECEAALAVRSADGQWFFGQPANGRQEVTLWAVPDGPLHVWVGAQDAAGCAGILTLETFDR